MKKRLGLLVFTLCCLFSVTACSPEQPSETSRSIIIGMPWEPRTLNPYRGIDSASYFAQTLVHGSLVRYNEKGDILPGLAERFHVSDDGLTYTFDLRKNLKFCDGSPLTVEDVLASIRATTGPGSPFRANYEAIESFEAKTPSQVVLHLSSRNLPLMVRLADMRILPASYLGSNKNAGALARQPIGCGPFLVHRWDPGFELVFKANPYYYGEKAKAPYLVWRIVPDGNLLSAALFRGDVDVARVDGRIELGILSEHSQVEFKKFPGARTIFLAFNTRKHPYDNPSFRQAISMLIDKYSIVNNLYAGFAVVPACDFPECGPVYNRLARRWPFNPLEAGKALRASGFEERSDGWYDVGLRRVETGGNPADKKIERLAFKIVTIKDFMDVAQVVAADLQNARIGVRVELVEYSTMKDKYLTTGDYDAVLFSRSQGPDPDCRLVWGKNGPLNYAHYQDDELDNLVNAAYKAQSEGERKELYDKIQALLAQRLPWVYLVQPSLTIAHKTYIKGIAEGMSSDNGIPWDNPLFNAQNWSKELK